MYKTLICAVMCLIVTPLLQAQHTDEIVLDDETSINPAIGERVIVAPTVTKPGVHSINSLPMLAGKQVEYSTALTGKNKGIITVLEGNTTLITGSLKKNKLHGNWVSRYANGAMLDSGLFVKNIPDGEWRSWYADGKPKTIRNYDADRWFLMQADINRGNTRTYHFYLSKLLDFSNKKFLSLTSAAASFNSLPPGQHYHAPYQFGLQHGLYVNYYPNGAIKDSGYYKDGLKDGLWIEYHTNGTLKAQGSFYHGLKHGAWKYLNRSGKLAILAEYKHGRLMHKKEYRHK